MRFYSRVNAFAAMGVASLALLTSCIDDKYDLSDIDDTIGVEVTDLVVPINLDPVEFSSVIDLEDEDGLEVENGQYVIRRTGEFDETVTIKEITADPYVTDEVQPVNIPANDGSQLPLDPSTFSFNYNGHGVSNVTRLISAKVNFDINVKFLLKGSNGRAMAAELDNVTFDMPAGLSGTFVNSQSVNGNRVTFKRPAQQPDGSYVFTFKVNQFDAERAHVEYTPARINYDGMISLVSGTIKTGRTTTASSLEVSISLTPMEVEAVTGIIKYEFTSLDSKQINLDNLPDVLTDDETNIGLANPQIYISLNNPLYQYGLTGKSGLVITQERENVQSEYKASMPNDLQIAAKEGVQHFLVCPDPDKTTPIAEFEGAKKFQINGLQNVLKGNGLPKGLKLDFVGAGINEGQVTDFQLGESANNMKLHGEYLFYAPLSFTGGSQIVYSGEAHGWDLGDDLEINTLTINADLNSDLPVTLALDAKPLDENGNVIKVNGKDVTVTVNPATIPANAKNQKITITLHANDGTLTGVDGMLYKAIIASGNDNTAALRPDMNLNLTNIKAKVTGRYVSKSND